MPRAVVRDPPRGVRVGRLGDVRRLTDLSRSQWVRRPAVLTLEILVGALVVVLIGVVAAHVRLLQGPVDLSFLVPPIERAINGQIAPLRAEIGSAVVGYETGVGDLRFRLRDIRIRGVRNVIVAGAPAAALSLSGIALMSGRIAPSAIELIKPAIRLRYDDDAGLALSLPERAETAGIPAADGGSTGAPTTGDDAAGIPITVSIAEALATARRHQSASAYLTQIGLRDARVVLDLNGKRSLWQLPEIVIAVDHREKRSVITGAGKVDAASGPFDVSFSIEESEKRQDIAISARLGKLVPSDLAKKLPEYGALAIFTMPIEAEARIALSTSGTIVDIDSELQLGRGALALASLGVEPMRIDEGRLIARYNGEAGRIEFLPSELRVGASSATIVGIAVPRQIGPDLNTWDFQFRIDDAKLGDKQHDLAPLAVDEWGVRGTFVPQSGLLAIERMRVRVQGGKVDLAGWASASGGIKVEAIAGTLPTEMLKRLWPQFLAGDARSWVAKNVEGGSIDRASVSITLTPEEMRGLVAGGSVGPDRIVVEFEGRDLEVRHLEGLPALAVPAARLTIDGSRLEVKAETATLPLPSGRRLQVEKTSFLIADMLAEEPQGLVTLAAKSSVDEAVELLEQEPFGAANLGSLKSSRPTGDASVSLKVAMPLVERLKLADLSIKGTGRLANLGAKKRIGGFELQGGTVEIAITDKEVGGKGKLVLSGVPVDVTWSRFLTGEKGPQPRLKLEARLDATDREQLGININHMLVGDLPVKVEIDPSAGDSPPWLLEADLTDAELVLENMAWRKPAGARAIFEARLVPRPGGGGRLEDLKISGDTIAIEGSAELNDANRLVAFDFTDFSFNVLTHLRIHGALEEGDVWSVKADGASYDGQQFFRSLFSAGKLTEQALPAAKWNAGVDLEARIGRVVGFEQSSLDGVVLSLTRRDGKVTALRARGTLTGGAPLDVSIDAAPGQPRLLVAKTSDAGSAFRLVGFYANIAGGQGLLKVDLDGSGPAEKTGVLTATRFALLGDQIVREVLTNRTDTKERSIPSRIKTEGDRVRINFNHMHVPFSVGHGLLELKDSYINGAEIGATFRGWIDFSRQQVRLGGTYVPLYGLNCIIPNVLVPLSPILSGRAGECLFGITFAIHGPLRNPQVAVNPISALTPGVFRQIFDFEPSAPSIQQRSSEGPALPKSRSSSSPAATGPGVEPSVGDALEPMTGAAPAAAVKKKKAKAAAGDDWPSETAP